MLTAGPGPLSRSSRLPWPFSSILRTASTRSTAARWAGFGSLVARLPALSVIALEARRDLDGEILPDFEIVGRPPLRPTQIAIRVLSAAAPGPGSEARLAVGQEPAADREEEVDV